MKFRRTIFSLVLTLTLLAGAGCGTSENSGPKSGPAAAQPLQKNQTKPVQTVAQSAADQEFLADNEVFEAAQRDYNEKGRDDSKQYTREQKIAACDWYIDQAKKMIKLYSDRTDNLEGIKSDLEMVRMRRVSVLAKKK